MAGFWKRWFGWGKNRPWKEGPSILAVLRSWDGSQPFELPDEPPAAANKLRFASGAWDGILTHHVGKAAEQAEAKVVYAVLAGLGHLIDRNDDPARATLYRLARQEAVVPYADAIVEELVRQRNFGPEQIRPHARWLVHAAAHREPLKLGIILLGLSGTRDDLPDLTLLARHDEFTLYAAVAAGNLLDNPVQVWWDMARRVHGWGKIQLVERLSQQGEDRPDLRAWLLRHGCANDVMPEYLAHRCATAGDLATALEDDHPDDALLDGACLIVEALLRGGPVEDMDDYEDGVAVVTLLLGHLAERCNSLQRLGAVRTIAEWLEWPATETPSEDDSDDNSWETREELGWTETVRRNLAEQCAEILGRPEWPEQVRRAYHSEDDRQRHLAWELAPAVGVDLWDAGFVRLTHNPLDSTLYWNLLRTPDAERVRRVIGLAEERLPLAEIATGPGDLVGLGPEFQAHLCLDALVQGMQRPEAFSEPLIAAALRSPVVRNRNNALNALAGRPVAEWGVSVRAALRRTLADEPDDELRERLQALAAKLS